MKSKDRTARLVLPNSAAEISFCSENVPITGTMVPLMGTLVNHVSDPGQVLEVGKGAAGKEKSVAMSQPGEQVTCLVGRASGSHLRTPVNGDKIPVVLMRILLSFKLIE